MDRLYLVVKEYKQINYAKKFIQGVFYKINQTAEIWINKIKI